MSKFGGQHGEGNIGDKRLTCNVLGHVVQSSIVSLVSLPQAWLCECGTSPEAAEDAWKSYWVLYDSMED
eukprot:5613211-Amphidinium_carterae.1